LQGFEWCGRRKAAVVFADTIVVFVYILQAICAIQINKNAKVNISGTGYSKENKNKPRIGLKITLAHKINHS
jgi:hypothetical protein